MGYTSLKRIALILVLVLTHSKVFCQTWIEGTSQYLWSINSNICTLKVGDSLILTKTDKQGVKFKLKNKYKSVLKSYDGVKVCGIEKVKNIKWVMKIDKRNMIRMTIIVNNRKYTLERIFCNNNISCFKVINVK